MFLVRKLSSSFFKLAFMSLMFASTSVAQADENAIAYVKVLNGACFVESAGAERILQIGDPLYKDDIVKTRNESSLGVSFRDNTLVSLGSNSSLKLNNFEFDPDNKKLAFAVQLFEGTLLYISGIIAKLTKNPDEDLQISTPAGTISVRGTKMFVRAE